MLHRVAECGMLVILCVSICFATTNAQLNTEVSETSTLKNSPTGAANITEPTIIYLSELDKNDENTLGLLSIPDGGRFTRTRCGSTYMHLPRSRDNMNVIFKDPRYIPTSADELVIQYAPHDYIDAVLPTTAIVFANMSGTTTNQTQFRLYVVTLLDVVSPMHDGTDDKSMVYRVDITNATQTVADDPTTYLPLDTLFQNSEPETFPSGTMMMDLIDADDETIDQERREYTLTRMIESGQLIHNADRFASKVSGEDLLNAQGVLTLWLLGPLSIPLYPAFIACCSFSLLIWYTIQPFLFCCII